MNCLIIDDDDLSRIDLEKKVAKVSFLKLVGSCASASGAPDVLLNSHVDLLILDVMMPGISGLQFLENLSERTLQVILISSDLRYAVNGFDHSVADFLVKPISDERFLKAAMRAYSLGQKPNGKSTYQKDHLFVKSNGVHIRLQTNSIYYIEAQPDHLDIVTESGVYKVHSTLKSVADSIPLDQFFRVHNSFIVNLQKISGLEGNFVLIQKKTIPVSRSRQKELMNRINMI
jgi:two-component system, LytTR family, response regulator LytT